MTDSTPNLTLPYIMAAQAQKHVTHNEALRALDALVQLSVRSRVAASPPATPVDGDRYIVPAAASGLWAGKTGRIAAYQDGAWQFFSPRDGWLAWVVDESAIVGYQGTTWSAVAGAGSGSANPWAGLPMAALGTSIIHNGTWIASLATALGTTVTNLGVSGGAWSSSASASPAACFNQVASIPSSTRLVMIEGAINDFLNNATLGALGDATTATFYGAMWRAVVDARALAPDALVVMCPLYATSRSATPNALVTNVAGRTHEDFTDAMRRVARALSCPIVELGASGVVGISYPAGAAGLDTSDGLHLTATASDHLAAFVSAQLKLVKPRPLYNQVLAPLISPNGGAFSAAQSVTITTAAFGAAIHFTLDGSEPTTSSPVYTGAITVSSTSTVKAIAAKAGAANSAVSSANFTITLAQVATPSFSPAAGSYTSAQSVTISCATVGASIYYSTDGSAPTTSSTLYSGAISVASTTTIRAIAVTSGMTDSAEASAAYTIAATVATPTFSPAAGNYTGTQSVTIACATAGATVHYTTDGSTPTTASAVYTAAISVAASATIRALAVKAGMTNSGVATAAYTISSFSPASVSPLAWYDPSDLATLWQDAAGTVAVTADGQSVARIDDKSGNGNHLVQADAARRPVYKTAGGLRWLEFDGANDWIGKAFAVAFPSSRVSALRYPAAQSEWSTFFNSWTGNATRLFMRATAGQFNSFNGAWPGDDASVSLGADIAVAETYTGDSSAKYIVNNGTALMGSAGTQTCDGFVAGANNSGGGSAAAFRWYGSVIKGSVMTNTQLAQLTTWLGTKAGVTV